MKLHHVALTVRNLEKSTKFYKDFFGFSEFKKFGRKEWGCKAIFLKLKDMQIELWQFDNPIENKDDLSNLSILGIKHLSFEVGDIDKKYREFKSKNIEISEPKPGTTCTKYCFLKDPDGIPIELYEK